MKTYFTATPIEKGNIEHFQARTKEELEKRIKGTCFSYKIEEVKKISNYDRFTEYAERESIKITPTNFRTWFNVYA